MLAQYTGKLPLFVQKQFDLKAGLPDMTNVFVKYVFYFAHEMKNMYISVVASPLMKDKYFPLHSMK